MPPTQVVLALGVGATVIPAGRLSVKFNAAATSALAVLSMVKVNVLACPTPTVAGVKALAKLGGGSTTRSAIAGTATVRPLAVRSLLVFG